MCEDHYKQDVDTEFHITFCCGLYTQTQQKLDSGTFLPGRFLPNLILTNRPDFLKPETPSAKEAQEHLHEYSDSQALSQKSGH